MGSFDMPGPKLPDLTPEMLLSPSARREYEAAVQSHASQVNLEVPDFSASEPSDWAMGIEDLEPPEDAFGISFEPVDVPEGVPLPTTPRESSRFRVDRGAPVYRHFDASMQSGPQGGPMQEVGHVGRFPVLAERPLPRTRPDRHSAEESLRQVLADRYVEEAPVPPRPVRVEKPIDRSKLPTEYDRLTGDFLENADDPFS
jgi:hypothetical protein